MESAMTKIRYHESSEIFPLQDKNVQDLMTAIKQNGLLDDIELYRGEILNGRSRYIACPRVGVPHRFVDVDDIVDGQYSGDTVQYSLDKNLHHRHLTSSQAAVVAIKAKELTKKFEKAAKERHAQLSGRPSKDKPRAARPGVSKRANDDLAKVFKISARQITRAQKVERECIPEVLEAVEKGKLTVTEAEEQLTGKKKGEQYEALKTIIKKNKPKPKVKRERRKKQGPKENEDPHRIVAVEAETEAINLLSRSKLVRMKKSNPYTDETFRSVINWLRRVFKEELK